MIFYTVWYIAIAFHVYIYWKLRRAFGPGLWNLCFFGIFAVSFVIPAARYLGLYGRGGILFTLTFTEYIIAGMLCAVFVLTDIARIILRVWDKAGKTRAEPLITPRRAAVFSMILVFCLAAYSYYEAWNVREVHITIPSIKLPKGAERIRVVQVSDIHIGGIYPVSHLERVMEMVRAAGPDIFVVTGDLADGEMEYRIKEAELIAAHGAKYGAFAVLGNHEYMNGAAQSVNFIQRCGLTLLRGEADEAGGIAVAGVDNFSRVWPHDLEVSNDRFVLLLKHRPQPLEGSEGKFDLQLSGHTHGGQIWPVGVLHQKIGGHVQGISKHGDAYVYVSNGTGYWAAPFRLFTPPEVTVIDLVNS